MHLPPAFAASDDEAWALIDARPLAQLVVIGDRDGSPAPVATPVPLLRRGTSLVGHLARPNPVARLASRALAIFTGPDAYVSPRWYAGKAVDGKVVPTWNYTTVQVHGRLVVHDDDAWVRRVVTDLTERFESAFSEPWAVSDAPEEYVATMMRGIVGIELVDVQVVGKAKLSQNRSTDDQARVADGLAAGTPTEQSVAAAMRDR